MSNTYSTTVSWGPLFNLTVGKLFVEDQMFSLVPNDFLTAVTLTVGKKAYSTKSFPIEAIIGYKNIFMAWMCIILNNGQKVRISVGTNNKKKNLITALEQRRSAIFKAKGETAPQLIATI